MASSTLTVSPTTTTPDRPLLCLLLMVTDEESVLVRDTLELTLPFVDEVVILDTGCCTPPSQLRQLRIDYPHKPIHVCEATSSFVDAGTSRNELLCEARARSTAQYFLSLNVSDRIIGGAYMRTWLMHYSSLPSTTSTSSTSGTSTTTSGGAPTVFLVQFECNRVVSMATRLFTNHKRLQYRWPVHEYLCDADTGDMCVRAVVPTRVRIAHPATTPRRLPQDKALLLALLPRVVDDIAMLQRAWYYIAQTCIDLQQHTEALFWLEQRIQQEGKNKEEYYLSVVRWAYLKLQTMETVQDATVIDVSGCGDHSGAHRTLQYVCPENIAQYTPILQRLVHVYGMYPQRAEALYYLAYIYGYISTPRNVAYAYVLASEVCRKAELYGRANCVQSDIYEFLRWDMLGHLAYMMGNYEEAIASTMTALGYKHITEEKQRELHDMLAVYQERVAL